MRPAGKPQRHLGVLKALFPGVNVPDKKPSSCGNIKIAVTWERALE
jgi:hypothetical protein